MSATDEYEERRRIQNLVAQRRWREKCRARQSADSSAWNHLERNQDSHYKHNEQVSAMLPSPQRLYVADNDIRRTAPPQSSPVGATFTSQDLISECTLESPGLPLVNGDWQRPIYPRILATEERYQHAMNGANSLYTGQIDVGAKFDHDQMEVLRSLGNHPGYDFEQTARLESHNDQSQIVGADLAPSRIELQNQIIESLKMAESLYIYGTTLKLFPEDSCFQPHIARAKEAIWASF